MEWRKRDEPGLHKYSSAIETPAVIPPFRLLDKVPECSAGEQTNSAWPDDLSSNSPLAHTEKNIRRTF
jgi:hypothetical protein